MSATAEALATFDEFDRHPSRRKTYAQIEQALRRLEVERPDDPKLPVFFKDGPFQFAGYVALREEPELRMEGERVLRWEVDDAGQLHAAVTESYVYVFVGIRDGVAHYELEVLK